MLLSLSTGSRNAHLHNTILDSFDGYETGVKTSVIIWNQLKMKFVKDGE